jgi:hypothetical protein
MENLSHTHPHSRRSNSHGNMCPQHTNQVKSEQNGLSNGGWANARTQKTQNKKKQNIVQEGGGNLPTCKVKFQYL